MPKLRFLLCLSTVAALGFMAPAQAAETVSFTMKASQKSLRDEAAKDTFTVGVSDRQVETTFKITCQGAVAGIISGQSESCAVTGNGALLNPNNGQKLQRTQYAGGWVVKSDGFTDGANMTVNYLALGKVPASAGGFGGSMVLKPEVPSTGASLLRDTILSRMKKVESGLIDERIDTVQFNNFVVPSAGLPSDKGCSWNGDMIYSYQTESWFMDIKAKCDKKEYALKGNMPFTATPNVGSQNQYDLTLTMPSASDDPASDEALFANATGDADLFAAADGLSGQIIMKESAYVDVEVDGASEKVASEIDATGTITGNNVPLELVRSFSTIVGIMARTFFGA
ncbi:MAG: hypothetical protein LCH46_06125 [Proteobacteria bacterium]|nr:hypothetical protein [Pseudomonadota bacterium]